MWEEKFIPVSLVVALWSDKMVMTNEKFGIVCVMPHLSISYGHYYIYIYIYFLVNILLYFNAWFH